MIQPGKKLLKSIYIWLQQFIQALCLSKHLIDLQQSCLANALHWIYLTEECTSLRGKNWSGISDLHQTRLHHCFLAIGPGLVEEGGK